jgi:type I restriction enzyme R subunit
MSYVRLYAFLLHVITFADPGLERLYDYARFLLRKLPRRDATSDFQVDDYVLLRRHRLAKVADQNMSLSALHETDSEVSGFKPVTVTDPLSDRKALSSLIQQLNDKFGADLTENDQLTFHQIEKDLEEDEELAQQARANDEDNYAFAFSDKFDDAVFERFMKNGKLFKRMQDDTAFRSAVMEWMRRSVYKTQRTEAAG